MLFSGHMVNVGYSDVPKRKNLRCLLFKSLWFLRVVMQVIQLLTQWGFTVNSAVDTVWFYS